MATPQVSALLRQSPQGSIQYRFIVEFLPAAGTTLPLISGIGGMSRWQLKTMLRQLLSIG